MMKCYPTSASREEIAFALWENPTVLCLAISTATNTICISYFIIMSSFAVLV